METANNIQTYRIHRVGTITAGMSMIVFGILMLCHSFFGFIDYQTVFSLWPVILIGLGLELLLSNFGEKRIVYDKAAVVLMIIMIFFAIGMAVADICIEAAELYLANGFRW